MSPIGRVFIVLNLVLAGGFAYVSGTFLQKQDNYKQQLEKANKAHADKVKAFEGQITQLEQERNTFENAKTANETDLLSTRNQLAQANDENKRLHGQIATLEGDVKKLVAIAEAGNTESKAAFDRAKSAYDMAIADQKVRDDAVRAKDAAEAENRTLKTAIASLEETVKSKDLNIAGLEKDRSELNLLVSVAVANGFSPAMAAPNLTGLVTSANGRLCTIQITDNPGKVDIADQIAKRPFKFAIHDASGYKGEAVATKYEASANAVLCNIFLVKDAASIKEGDKAATLTP
jgi:flagellar biosynthesis chaperone FliJ